MKRSLAILAIAVAIRAALAAADEPADDARALVKRVIDAAPHVPYASRMTLTTPGGLVREFKLDGKRLATGVDTRYLEVTSPFNIKDTRYLFYDRTENRDDQFVYLPSMKRIIRLSEQTRREPFLGSTFFVIDMVERPLDDFTYRFVGTDTVGQRSCRLVESVPKHREDELYGRSVIAIDPVDLVVTRVEIYDRDGRLFKVHTIDTLEKIDGYWTPRVQTMRNVQDDTASQLTTVEIQYNVPLGDDIFREAYLGR